MYYGCICQAKVLDACLTRDDGNGNKLSAITNIALMIVPLRLHKKLSLYLKQIAKNETDSMRIGKDGVRQTRSEVTCSSWMNGES